MPSTMPSTFEIELLAGGSGLRLVGELDLAAASQLGRQLAEAETTDGFVLDVSELTFIDSSGCGTILSYLRGAGDETRLVLANPSPALFRTFELMGLPTHPQIEIRSMRVD